MWGFLTRRRGLLAVAGWLLAAVVATSTGTAAISLVRDGLTHERVQPLTPAQVDQALSRPRRTPSTAPSRSPEGGSAGADGSASADGSVGTGGQVRSIATDGGTVLARCAGGTAYVLSWSPSQGYAAGTVERGPAPRVRVRFERDDSTVEVRITCRNGVPGRIAPPPSSDDDDDDDGGGGGDD